MHSLPASPEYSWLELGEFSHEDMAKGKELLARAWDAAGADETLRARLALVRFGHALITYTIAAAANETKRPLTRASFEAARNAWELARALRKEYRIMLYCRTTGRLKTFGLEPPADSMIFDLPIQWKFRKDPADQGLEANSW